MDKVKPDVQEYMKDENRCLQEWYRAYYSSELYPGEPCAVLPGIDKMKESFENWTRSKQKKLFNLICVEWNYPAKHKDTKFQDKILLASSLTDFLISCVMQIPSPITTAVLLVRMGLENFCDL
jgi:hypothetical protein